MAKRTPTRSDHLRSAVAQEAARLMSEHGIQDFLLAKRKAAERYGVAEASLLPRNVEIEAALLERHRLFGGSKHVDALYGRRRVALKAMQLLQGFEPRLVGTVLNGTATEHSDIHLHVFSDNPEAVALHLMDRRFDLEIMERRFRTAVERPLLVPTTRFEMENVTVEAFIFPQDGIRQSPIGPVDGKPMRRAAMHEVEDLLSK